MIYYNYIVDANWPGAEGEKFMQGGYFTFRMFRSLQGAIDDSKSGDSIGIRPGTYDEQISWPSGGRRLDGI